MEKYLKSTEVKIKLSELDLLYYRTYGYTMPSNDNDRQLIAFYKAKGLIK